MIKSRQYNVLSFGGLVAEFGLRETSDKERAAQLIVNIAADGSDLEATSLGDRVGALIRSGRPADLGKAREG